LALLTAIAPAAEADRPVLGGDAESRHLEIAERHTGIPAMEIDSLEVTFVAQGAGGVTEAKLRFPASVDKPKAGGVTEAKLRFPASVDKPIAFTSGAGEQVSIGLPDNGATASIEGGAVIYRGDEGRRFSMAAEAIDTVTAVGWRTLVMIDSEKAPTEYEFSITHPDDWSLEITAEGGVLFTDGEGFPVGAIEAPWAVDAAGEAVRTSFELRADTLIQTVIHNTGTVKYPVTADPSVTFGRNIYVWFSAWELLVMSSMSAAVLAWWICSSVGTAHPALCAMSIAGAQWIALALDRWYSESRYRHCRGVIAFRYWGWPNYFERVKSSTCPYMKYEIPG